ncbi:DUF2510 domain-containing protein [Microbacterium sp. SS28]|uniref:DUF2510 domain-containing protein n=1 Tax=Microbacterium sp. SS28 TaxID=2919948 RepID=UPI001FA94836|nr:DUF2510 domain-containing protein [Microbacterium sp. SS28]
MTTSPPGWYDDGHGAQRWWDGARWTDHVRTPETPASPFASPATPVSDSRPSPAPTAYMIPGTGYPGADPASPTVGPPVPEPERRASRAGIVWAIAGGAALLVVAAVVIFVTLTLATGPAPTVAVEESPAPDAAEEDEEGRPAPDSDDVYGAIDVIHDYSDAVLSGSCEDYFWDTTEDFRANIGATDCDEFAALSAEVADGTQDRSLFIGEIHTVDEGLSVAVRKTYTSSVDPEGNPTETPARYEDRHEYLVIPWESRWVIDDRSESMPTTPDPADPLPDPDQQAAVDAVLMYNDAWLTADCDAYMLSTTAALREYSELADCAAFTSTARDFASGTYDYVTTVRNVATDGGTISVSVTETYTSLSDNEGTPTDSPEDYADRWEYIVVSDNGVWAIDDVYED